MYNNAVDHSDGSKILVDVTRSARSVSLLIQDDGIGVFEKIRSRFHLPDHRAAILELSKGKLTTDPSRHSGQGIFFTSRMFDQFMLTANHLFFNHLTEDDDWLIEIDDSVLPGTTVEMTIALDSDRTTQEVFDHYAPGDEDDDFPYPFSKTHVPLSLAQYGNEQLVSRSQAKRVLARFERFEEVLLDFSGIDQIGQAFADEIFRVFRRAHPEIKLVTANASPTVLRMIRRAENPANEPSGPDPA